MKCPACPDTTLVMTDRQGVEIDYCPACRGIWLDRGELDKLLDRAATATNGRCARCMSQTPQHHRRAGLRRLGLPHRRSTITRRRKKSWLNDFFD
jgi:Zn-finger nucleic acid-binding protein